MLPLRLPVILMLFCNAEFSLYSPSLSLHKVKDKYHVSFSSLFYEARKAKTKIKIKKRGIQKEKG